MEGVYECDCDCEWDGDFSFVVVDSSPIVVGTTLVPSMGLLLHPRLPLFASLPSRLPSALTVPKRMTFLPALGSYPISST